MKTKQRNALCVCLSAVMVLCLSLSLVFAVRTPVKADAEPQHRVYDAEKDRMLDDGTGAGAVAAYRSVSWEAGKCSTVNDPVFKIGSAKISAGFEKLNIELRSPDASIKLNDLKLGLRTADNDDAVYAHSYVLGGEDMIGGIDLSSGSDISAEWAVMTIDFAATEAGVNTAAADAVLGFHLYTATENVAGQLDIRKVSVTTGTNETTVLDFADVNESWWYGSDGGTYVDYPKHYEVTERTFASDEAALNNLDEAYAAIVLNIGGNGNVSLAPVLEDGVGKEVAWGDLKDLNGTSLPALEKGLQSVVVSLESLGASKIKGVKVSVENGTAQVGQVFFTNMSTEEPDKYFPVLDVESIKYMTQFNFEYLTAGPDYDKAVEECAKFNCDYILSYSAKNNVITDGHLVLDAQGEAFTSIKIRSKSANEGAQYLVIKYLLDNASLDQFRFSTVRTESDLTSAIVYANDLLVGNQLKSLSDANPYNTESYKYLVIDIDRTFGNAYICGLDMYFSGEGRMLIDEVYYIDSVDARVEIGEEVLAEDFPGKEVTATAPGYAYIGWVNGSLGANADYMIVEVEGDISELRFGMGGGTYWAKANDEGTLLDKFGKPFEALTGAQTLVIDLAKTGVKGQLSDIHIHNTFANADDVLKITSVKFASHPGVELVYSEEALAEDFPGKEVTAAAPDYAYIGWVDTSLGTNADYMIVELEGDLTNFRIEMGGGTYWVANNPQGSLVDENGNQFPANSTKLVIDLAKTGVKGKLNGLHMHNTFANAGDVLKIKSVKFASLPELEMVLGEEALAEDFPGKEVTATAPDYAYIGWVNGSVAGDAELMVVEAEGDLTNLRFGMAGGAYWVVPNAEGTLVGTNGNLPTSGKQTLVVDLAKTGIQGKIGDIHIHNTFANVGDVLKITSVKFGSYKRGYEDIVLPVNDDSKPVLTVSMKETAELGEEVVITASATDNYSEVTLTYEVTVGTDTIAVTDSKFVASKAGTYAVKVRATDASGNETISVLNLTVEEKPEEPKPEEPQPETKGCLGSGLDGLFGAIAICGLAVVVIASKKRKAE